MYDECYLDLASAIIKTAIWDYVHSVKYREEVLDFFRSDWGRFLCDHTGTDPDRVIELLLGLGDGTVKITECRKVVAATFPQSRSEAGGCRRGRLMVGKRPA